MRRNDSLYRLITSMSRSEKRYFKVSAPTGGKEKKYLMLFDAISEQREYDEKALKDRFRDEKFIRQFSVAKNYLYKLIMRSLRQFHAEETVESRLQTMLTDVQLLIDRGLIDQAESLNERAILLAKDYEKPLLLLKGLQLRERTAKELRTSLAKVTEMKEEQLDTVDTLRDVIEQKMLLYEMSVPVRQGAIRRKEEHDRIDRLIQHPLLNPQHLSSSLISKVNYHWGHSIYAFLKLDYPGALPHVKAIISLLESTPDRLNDLMDSYLMGLNNALVLYRRLDKKKEFEEIVGTIRELIHNLMQQSHSSHTRRNAHIFTSLYLHLLALHVGNGDFSEGLALTDEVTKGLVAFESHIPDDDKMKFHLNLALIYFGVEEFRRSLDHINHILLEYSPEANPGTYYAARLINLIVHFELKNYCLLTSITPSTLRYLLSHDSVYKLEQTMVSLFQKLPKAKSDEDVTEVFTQTRNTMVTLQNDPVEAVAFQYFGYVEWLESRIQKKPFAEIMRTSRSHTLSSAS